MEAWECYQMYLGLKLHFTTDYDYKKYSGKTSATKASFLKRRDRNFFAKTARKYDDKTIDFEGDDQPSIEERTFFLRTKELTVETSKLNIQTYIFRSIVFFGICLLVTLWFR